MNRTKIFQILVMLFTIVLCFGPIGMAAPMGTVFTYQGRLIDANEAADGLYDFQFKLFDANSDGNQVGGDVNESEIDVIDGYFTVELDFGSVFDGNSRWLDIGVRPGELEDPNVYTALSPRQEITPAPYALYASGGGSGGSFWQMNGSDIYYNNGNVGIGTASPANELDVSGRINASDSYKLNGITILDDKGSDNIFVGPNAGASNTTGNYNSALGSSALYSNTTGYSNTAVGDYALNGNIGGEQNTAVGDCALLDNDSGSGNSALGYSALTCNISGGWNAAFGYYTLSDSTTGILNSAFGESALGSNIAGSYNTAVGSGAGYNSTGSGNVFLGYNAGYNETGTSKLYIANNSGVPLIYGDFIAGRVGLGTTSPATKLDIAGQVKITGGSPGVGKVLTSDEAGLATWQTPVIEDTDWTISGNDMYSGVTGNVGIGTASPGKKLDVAGGINAANYYYVNGKVLAYNASGTGDIYYGWDVSVQKHTMATGGTERLVIDNSGNVGIGTTSPSTKLDVAGQIKISGGSPDNGRVLTSDAAGLASWQIPVGDNLGNHIATTNIRLNDNWISGDGDKEGISVAGSGNVGIGTMSPATKLDVAGQIKISGGSPAVGRVLTSDAAGLATWQIPVAADNLGNHIATTNIRLNDNWLSGDGDSEGVSVAGNGNVGIGTMSPSAKLDVTGDINVASVYRIDGNAVLSATHPYNTFLGVEAGQSNTGSFNTFLGNGAGNANTTGSWNTFAGYSSGSDNIIGSYNTFFGNGSGWHSIGYHNTFSGYQAGMNKTSGNYNTFTGSMTGQRNTTGTSNTFFGSKAGYNNISGSGNVFIGHEAGYNQTGSDKLYIANSRADANVLIYGDFSTRRLGIGTTSPSGRLEVSHDGSTHDFVVDANGDAGIGISPNQNYKLFVSGGDRSTAARFDNWSTYNFNYGVAGFAQGSGGTNHYGVYGYATGGTNNWAGYFNGDLYAAGNVGIGTESPARKLHVNDVMRLQPRATAPSSPAEGDIYMDSSTHKLMVYDGTAWRACW